MAYRSTEKTRQKKDAKRTAMMQAAVQVFAEKGYHTATIRDIVKQADVAIGTFYFYFPDKETLFVYLYEETADFLLQTLNQAINSREGLPERILATTQAYVNLGTFEPTVINLLLVGGIGAIPSLHEKRFNFRESLIRLWQIPLDDAMDKGQIPEQDTRISAEMLAGGFDEVLLNIIGQAGQTSGANSAEQMTQLALNMVGYKS